MKLALIDQRVLRFLAGFQAWFFLTGQALVRIFRKPSYYRDFAIQFDKLGFSSLFICLLTGLFTGMVMALQALIQLKPFAATSYVGGMVAVTMIKELGPVLAALMVAGRVGSAITAELGTMVVTEQVDAMRVEGTDIIQRLVTPRLKAMLLALPLLTVITDAIAMFGGYLIATGYDISPIMYLSTFTQFMVPLDYLEGVFKPLVFACLITMTGCYVGLNTAGGAEGVGASAKRAVVISSVMVLMCDFFIAKLFVVFR
ncbi:MlaE family ABC transporter permease [Trichlorobacter ammonificans]|uniref:ABC transporter permease protein RBE_1340 n=1 Tax=Trichlorobacter ammonificans TaxID=2916410 RepID=A0ABN8HQJ3_9BACT|nr:ABC transporter permease [Trichlorobacter ammonificans]CAH2032260.1 putative ABC transporter permease protein RBE_1340 [Trichlorobacter ammonificans]